MKFKLFARFPEHLYARDFKTIRILDIHPQGFDYEVEIGEDKGRNNKKNQRM